MAATKSYNDIMSETIKSKLRIRQQYGQKVTIEAKKLEIRPSSTVDASLGVFAVEPIPAGTIFLEVIDAHIENSDTVSKKINDLAYHGNCSNYDTEENIACYTNVGYIVQDCEHQYMQFFGMGSPSKIYLYALKDINESEELSRYYGLDYWFAYEFWQRFPNNRFKLTQAMEDLPGDWVFIDEIRSFIEQNTGRPRYPPLMNK